VQRLVDVADPMTQKLERRQLLLVGCLRRCQDGKVVLDRTHHTFFRERALITLETDRVAREINEVLACALLRPIGPIARRAKRRELLIQLDERNHPLAGGVVQLEECQLADRLMTEAAPGEG
jgi:hypothetical protein